MNKKNQIQYGLKPMGNEDYAMDWEDDIQSHFDLIRIHTERSAASFLIFEKRGDAKETLYMCYPFSFAYQHLDNPKSIQKQVDVIMKVLKEPIPEEAGFGEFSREQKLRLLEIPFKL